jgi:WD40 repeat protein
MQLTTKRGWLKFLCLLLLPFSLYSQTGTIIRTSKIQQVTAGNPELQQTLPITGGGTTYAMTQDLTWVDAEHFAVGRWDGSMSIFKFTPSPTAGPLITEVVNTPSSQGVEMVTAIGNRMLATSNDSKSVIIWSTISGTWTDIRPVQKLVFDTAFGGANSGAAYLSGDKMYQCLVVGHANGYVTFWRAPAKAKVFSLVKSVNIRAASPVNPYGLFNVRGINLLTVDKAYSYVVTGSEDGDLCVVRFPDGKLLSRTLYNPAAKFGINSISSYQNNLLVANCSADSSDKNLWQYTINPSDWSITLKQSFNLKVNPTLTQVFNFDVTWVPVQNTLYWFSTTQEGYLWVGILGGNGLIEILGKQSLGENLGASIGVSANRLAVAGQNVHEFTVQQ